MIFSMTNQRASALLLSFFVMTLLILTGIGVSVLVLQDTAAIRTAVSGVQSHYAAEGATELGLYELEENLPGYEPSLEGYELVSGSVAGLDVAARGSVVPCGEEGDWRALGQNESVQLALFSQVDSGGAVEKLSDFYVEFYVGAEDGTVGASPPSSDVLRWKILGFKSGNTEAISEYIGLDPTQYSDAVSPSLFGPAIPTGATLPEYSYAKYYEDMGSYYVYHDSYSISDFLLNHDYSYLVLTNVVQGGGSGGAFGGVDEGTIFFRLNAASADAGGPEAVCEYVALESVGETAFGSTEEFLETYVKEGENLPVFDFVLYHTAED
jgi:hypothetical protein